MSIPHASRAGLSLTLLTLVATAAAEDPSTQAQLDALRQQNAELAARLGAIEQRQSREAGGAQLHLTDLSLDVLTVAGASTATDTELPGLQGGGHDPRRRGFTFQGAELSIAGAVDPFFVVETHLVGVREEPSGDTGIEVEEAYARTTALPAGLEAKLGIYLLEFGRFNPTHPHAWQFIDQPVILTRVFGGDGQRTPGGRLLCSLPTPWLSELTLGVADANGGTAPSFLSNSATGAVAGRPFVGRGTGSLGDMLYNLRWSNAIDTDDAITKVGLSAATGPNATGARTVLWGADLAWRWHPAGGERGWPFVLVESEYIERAYRADAADLVDGAGVVIGSAGAATLRDRGCVAQVVWGFTPGWAAGVRGEYCWSQGEDIVAAPGGGTMLGDAGDDPLRDRRTRSSALLSWQPSEFSHFRLQFDHDRAEHLDHPADSVWLGAEFLIGAHPAHTF